MVTNIIHTCYYYTNTSRSWHGTVVYKTPISS